MRESRKALSLSHVSLKAKRSLFNNLMHEIEYHQWLERSSYSQGTISEHKTAHEGGTVSVFPHSKSFIAAGVGTWISLAGGSLMQRARRNFWFIRISWRAGRHPLACSPSPLTVLPPAAPASTLITGTIVAFRDVGWKTETQPVYLRLRTSCLLVSWLQIYGERFVGSAQIRISLRSACIRVCLRSNVVCRPSYIAGRSRSSLGEGT